MIRTSDENYKVFFRNCYIKTIIYTNGMDESILKNPMKKEIQPDGRIRYWGYVKELDKYLRIITLDDGLTIHNVFPDRNFKEN